jgi:hypothetical protein
VSAVYDVACCQVTGNQWTYQHAFAYEVQNWCVACMLRWLGWAAPLSRGVMFLTEQHRATVGHASAPQPYMPRLANTWQSAVPCGAVCRAVCEGVEQNVEQNGILITEQNHKRCHPSGWFC